MYSIPLTFSDFKLASRDKIATFKVTLYDFEEPSGAVTRTFNVFVPSTSPDLPVTVTVDSGSEAIALTLTLCVNAGSSRVAPSTIADPLIWKLERRVSDEGGVTYSPTLYEETVFPSAAVITIVTGFSPDTRFAAPVTDAFASGSLAIALTEAALVPRTSVNVESGDIVAPFTWIVFNLESLERGTMTEYL